MKTASIHEMGNGLRQARAHNYPNDTQADFAKRIGVSRYTYQKMERGETSVAMGHYFRAAQLLSLESRFERLFDDAPTSLFAP